MKALKIQTRTAPCVVCGTTITWQAAGGRGAARLVCSDRCAHLHDLAAKCDAIEGGNTSADIVRAVRSLADRLTVAPSAPVAVPAADPTPDAAPVTPDAAPAAADPYADPHPADPEYSIEMADTAHEKEKRRTAWTKLGAGSRQRRWNSVERKSNKG